MKNVSNEYKAIAESLDGSARYYHQILVDGVELTDTIVEFKYSHTCNNSTNFSVGNTASAMVEFKIDEPSINLENKEIEVNQGLKLADGSMEYAKLGKFKVLSPEIERFQANYQCVDAMTYKMATVYESTLTYPTTDIAILEEICQQAGIELANTDLVAHTIDRKLDNYTKREIIGFIAQLQGKNAIINTDGKLEFIWYTQTDYVVDDNRIYSDRTDIIKNENDYVLGYIKSTYGSKEIVSGDIDTQGIRITNPYMTQDILDEVFNKIKGLTFRAINVDFYGDFRLEVGDIVTVNTNNESYVVPIMTLEQSSDGGVVTSIESIGETSTQNSVDTNGGILNEIKRSVVNSETARSIAEQSADKINFIVEGDSVSEFTISDKALNIISENIDLTGKVTFNSFDKETQETLSNISEPIKQAEGSPILITDSAESNLIDFKAYGRSTQKQYSGKNLMPYPYKDATKTINGITFTDNGDGSITMNGTATADAIFLLSPIYLKAGTYTLSVSDSGFNSNLCNFQLSNSENNVWWGFKAETSSIGTRTYTLDEDLLFNYNRLLVKAGHTMDNVTWKPMVRRAEVTDDTYEPYVGGTPSPNPDYPQDIVSVGESGTLEIKSEGKNLYDVSLDTTRTNVGVTATINSNQTMTLSGTSTGAGALPSSSTTKHKIKANIGDILTLSVKILSGNATIASNTSLAYMNVYVDGTILNNVVVGFINAPTNTVNSDTEITDTQYLVVTENMFSADGYIHIVSQTYVRSGDVYNDLVLVRQLEVNSVATEYEPYKSSTVSIPLAEPLRSVGEVRDEIACVDGVYGVIRRIASEVFKGDSSEGWYKHSTLNNVYYRNFAKAKGGNNSSVWSHFTNNDDGVNEQGEKWDNPNNGTKYVCLEVDTLDEWLAWLQSNNITVQYILAEGVFEPFADQTPFYNIATFDSATYITATDNAEMKVEYFRNTSTGQQLSNANTNATNALNKANSVDSTLSSLCILEDNKTVIDGSKIYTGSITADKIDVKDLFAQDITATGTITGVKLYGASGEFEGDIASYGTVTLYSGAWQYNPDGTKEFIKDAGALKLSAEGEVATSGGTPQDMHLFITSNMDEDHKTYIDLTEKNVLVLKPQNEDGSGGAEIVFGLNDFITTPHTKLIIVPNFKYKDSPVGEWVEARYPSPYTERLMADKLAVEDAYLENITTVNPINVNTDNWIGLKIKRIADNSFVNIQFENNDGILGYLSISNIDGRFIRRNGSDNSKMYEILDASGGTLTGTLYYGADKSYYTNTSGLAVLNKINLDNAGGIFMKDSSGKLRTAVNLSASNVWSFATGGMEHSIVFGNNEKTNSMKIYGATIQIGDTANTTKILLNSAVSISGNVDLKSTEAKNITLQLTNSKRSGALSVSKDGHLGIWDSKFNNWMIYSDLNQNISIKGNTSVDGNMSPTVNSNASAGYSIGSPNFRWKYVYAYSSSIQTSDRRYKENIEYINNNDVLSKFFDALRPCTYFMAGGDRKHIGFIAQDVEQIMQDNGMTIDDLSFVCKDPEYKLLDESKPDSEDNREYLYDENGEPLYVYGLKYTELHGLEVNEIQKLKQRVNDLEFALSQALARIDALESKLS